MAVREKTQADFDLEKMFAYLDEALTSKDERVQSALRGLLTIIELTRTQDDGQMAVETSHGPLRQMQEDLNHISRRLNNLHEEVRQMKQPPYIPPQPFTPPPPYNPAIGPYTNPGGLGPIWTTSGTDTITLTDAEKDAIINHINFK